MPSRQERRDLIEKLQDARGGTTVIAYVTTTRPNLSAHMSMDVVPLFYEHLKALSSANQRERVDVLLHSDGGDGTLPWRLLSLLREYATEVNLLVPHRAFSAATLMALGCDRVIMHPMGTLGPIDPTVNGPFNPADSSDGQRLGISVEDVAAYINLVKEDVGITHEDELVLAFNLLADKVHPLALGNVKRITNQSRMLAGKLLDMRETKKDAHTVEDIIDKLGSKLFYHGHPISRNEARDHLGLDFVEDAAPEVESAMWELYSAYATDMRLNEEFQPVNEALAQGPVDAPVIQQPAPGQFIQPPPNVAVRRLPPFRGVMIESTARCDMREGVFEVALIREWSGKLTHLVNLRDDAWRQDA